MTFLGSKYVSILLTADTLLGRFEACQSVGVPAQFAQAFADLAFRPGIFASQSILALALESGFNSKAAFNAAFKRYAGTTPSAYRRENC